LFYPLEIIVFMVLFGASYYLLMPAAGRAIVNAFKISSDNTIAVSLVKWLLTFIPILVFFCYGCLVQKRPLSSFGFSLTRVNAAKDYGTGFLIGILMIAAVILLEVMFGFIHFTGVNGASVLPLVLLFLLGFLIQGMAEEIEFRGFFMISIARRYPVWLAVITNPMFFGILHMFNKGATVFSTANTIMVGILFSIIMLKRDSIWMAGAMHSAWNFGQSNLFAQRVSGSSLTPSLFEMTTPTGIDMISGGDYGVEAGVFTTVILIIMIILALRMKTVRKSA
jgi:membrane protease YdiL (CAAX protease family)